MRPGRELEIGGDVLDSVSLFQGVLHCLTETAKLGPKAFYKVLSHPKDHVVSNQIGPIHHSSHGYVFINYLVFTCHLLVSRQSLVPAGIRLMPQTVLTFIFLEQLRKYFGVVVIT